MLPWPWLPCILKIPQPGSLHSELQVSYFILFGNNIDLLTEGVLLDDNDSPMCRAAEETQM